MDPPGGARRRTQRLPVVRVGAAEGQCFIAAILAHVHGVDGATCTVDKRCIAEARRVEGVPKGATYLDGKAQQRLAEHYGVGYVVVDAETRVAAVYTMRDRDTPYFALLARTKGRHVDPIATAGRTKCGLVPLTRVRELLDHHEVRLAVPCAAADVVVLP